MERADVRTLLVLLACCRARQGEDSQSADESLYFMVLDVIEEAGGRFNVMGKTEGEQSILVQVHDFEPYFYIGQPVFKARPQFQAHAEAGRSSVDLPGVCRQDCEMLCLR